MPLIYTAPTKAEARRLAGQLKQGGYSAVKLGTMRGMGGRVHYTVSANRPKANPPMKKRTKRKNAAPKSRSLSLRNFTGKVRLNPDKTVSVLGVGKKKAKAKKGKR